MTLQKNHDFYLRARDGNMPDAHGASIGGIVCGVGRLLRNSIFPDHPISQKIHPIYSLVLARQRCRRGGIIPSPGLIDLMEET
jgi:hypothetical protein